MLSRRSLVGFGSFQSCVRYGIGILSYGGICSFVLGRLLLIARERHIRGRFEELLPEARTFPDVFGVGSILLNNGKDAGCDNSVGAAEVVINF